MIGPRHENRKRFAPASLKIPPPLNHRCNKVAQGLNSAQAFRDRGFRRLAREQCPDSHSFIFGDETRIADHTVTFAIITQAPGELKAALPFFSKQSLVNATRELSNMGYQVRLKKIPVTAAAAA